MIFLLDTGQTEQHRVCYVDDAAPLLLCAEYLVCAKGLRASFCCAIIMKLL